MGELQSLLNFLLSIVSILLIWILKDMKADVKELAKEVHTNFVRKDTYSEDIKDIKDVLTRIFDKLDNKVDKK